MLQSLSLLSVTPATFVPSSISLGINSTDLISTTNTLLTINKTNNNERYGSIVNSSDIIEKCSNHKSVSRSTNVSRTKSETTNNNNSSIKTFILYLIRHGEALHNVKEKAAKQRAKEEALEEGHEPDSEEVRCRMEEARKAVLNDHKLFDAPLSEVGQEEARNASYQLQRVIADSGLESPSHILVSPLQRTLQTADILFPDHMNIHVREEIRERCTGKPPDTYASFETLRRRSRFQRFSMIRLKESETLKELKYDDCDCREACYDAPQESSSSEEDDDQDDNSNNVNNSKKKKRGKEENRAMLRTRTKKLLHLLEESDHRSIAVVSHKGYLRELERGPFEQTDAKEFKNCEMRVYKVNINRNDDLDSVSRIV